MKKITKPVIIFEENNRILKIYKNCTVVVDQDVQVSNGNGSVCRSQKEVLRGARHVDVVHRIALAINAKNISIDDIL